MRIITTTANDFVKQEISEWGWDYVDDMFAQGYEPTLINGIWSWHKDVLRTLSPNNGFSHNSCDTVHNSRDRFSLV